MSIFKDYHEIIKEREWNHFSGPLKILYLFFILNYLIPLLIKVVPNIFVPLLHKIRGVKIGKNVWIDSSVIIDQSYPQNITIEDDVRIAAGTIIMAHSRGGHFLRKKLYKTRISNIRIKKYCFIGINCVVMPGVTIDIGTIVNSGSVVMTNTRPFSIFSGNPAKKIKDLDRN